jgi:hypothetical protein
VHRDSVLLIGVCLGLLLSLISPRLFIAVLFLFGDYLDRGYGSWFWPTLGFFFMPWTTLAYAWAVNANHHSVSGIYLVAVILAVLVDVSGHGGAGNRARRRR